MSETKQRIVDAHQHFYDFDRIPYTWPTVNEPELFRSFHPEELEPLLRENGIDETVIVQADHSDAETDYLLEVGDRHPWVAGVVGWVDLRNPEAAGRRLEALSSRTKFKGVRHLIHDEADPDWVIQPAVLEGLGVLADFEYTYDVVAVLPRHLEHVCTLAERLPKLRLVIDHLAKPPIRERQLEPWATLLREAAQYPNVFAKVSGLNTAADPDSWAGEDLKPYIEHAMICFGADRLMFGSDWPVANLAGDYRKVWLETNRALAGFSDSERQLILGGTAAHFYNLD
ncbi:amidohydrolase family protein [Paenibacillus sp. 1P07SE]|uniref:amidohydrolase family protein n=1 Tax=Paenibacillus sp. 1P07SE TaxID=3132209 RepID=UPI0039A77AF1